MWEIVGPNLRLLRTLAAAHHAPEGLFGFMNDPRVKQSVADGRNALERTSERFDIIEIDALWPTNAYSGNVYSREFFSHCARRLKPGGLMSTWAPTPRVYASFAEAFPYVIAFEGRSLLVGSNEALPVAFTEWRARLETAEVQRYLGARRSDEVRRVLRTGTHVVPSGKADACVNTDLYPRDEFQAPDPGCSALTRPDPVRWRDLRRP